MFPAKDLILFLVIYSSLPAGIFLARACEILQPFPLYGMMSLLLLGFLSTSLSDISETLRSKGLMIGVAAPFVSGLLQANTPLVLVVVVCSSLQVCFTLPPVVDIL